MVDCGRITRRAGFGLVVLDDELVSFLFKILGERGSPGMVNGGNFGFDEDGEVSCMPGEKAA